MTCHRDGSGYLVGRLTSFALATWQAVLDPLAAPRTGEDPSRTDGAPRDERSAAQRRHDGFVDAGERLLRSGTLPDCGGTPVSVAVTMTLDQLAERTGLVSTDHGVTFTVDELLRQTGEVDLLTVVSGRAAR